MSGDVLFAVCAQSKSTDFSSTEKKLREIQTGILAINKLTICLVTQQGPTEIIGKQCNKHNIRVPGSASAHRVKPVA